MIAELEKTLRTTTQSKNQTYNGNNNKQLLCIDNKKIIALEWTAAEANERFDYILLVKYSPKDSAGMLSITIENSP